MPRIGSTWAVGGFCEMKEGRSAATKRRENWRMAQMWKRVHGRSKTPSSHAAAGADSAATWSAQQATWRHLHDLLLKQPIREPKRAQRQPPHSSPAAALAVDGTRQFLNKNCWTNAFRFCTCNELKTTVAKRGGCRPKGPGKEAVITCADVTIVVE